MERLKCEGKEVATSVSGLESLRREFDEVKLVLQRQQQDVERVENNSTELDKAFRTWVPKSLSFPMKEAEPVTEADPSWDWKKRDAVEAESGTWVPRLLGFRMNEVKSVDPSWDEEKREAVEKENEAKSLDGIISYLTKKHGGNVQEKGIVTITSKSVLNDDPNYALKNVADLTSDALFWSNGEPDQWVCWDFRETGVCPTHYTLEAMFLKSWVVEGSLDGTSWTEIDRQTDNQEFRGKWNRASFAISKPGECRFIRLAQTGKNHDGTNVLFLGGVEFFGTLSE
jgi:hypothetical protein